MNEFNVGGFVISTTGHDSGKYYVIFQTDSEYVYLVDGKIRTPNHTKKKKKKHVKMLEDSDQTLIDKVTANTVRKEEIKRAIKLLQYSYSNKEEKSSCKTREAKASWREEDY